MSDDIIHFAPERSADLIETINASTADWPHCCPIDSDLLGYWQTSRPEYRPKGILMHYSGNRCMGILHGEQHNDTAHTHLLALRPDPAASETGLALMREWERLARQRHLRQIVSPTWRASLFYCGHILGNEPYHPHWATAATDAYLRAGFRISHPALILTCGLPRPTSTPERLAAGYEVIEVTPNPEHRAQAFGFHAMHNGVKAAHCYARLYPHLPSVPSGKPTGQIGNVTTEPDHRNRGLARILVAMALRRLTEMGAGEALIATGLDNEPALRAYERCGFERRHFIMEWSKSLISRS